MTYLTGDKQLLQFMVSDPIYKQTESLLNGTNTQLNGKFILKRNPSGLILNLFVPSLSIILMTIVPLYLKDDFHFSTTIMLVLTSMLCLYTLFQSSLSNVPTTAYLKFIDYWNILSLVITVSNFFILIVWQMYNDNREKIRHEATWRHMKNMMRVFLPVITLVVVFIYIMMAEKVYNEH